MKINIGSLPIYQPPDDEDEELAEESKEEAKEKGPKVITKTVVLPDGSYGTQTIVVEDGSSSAAKQSADECSYLPLRNALVNTDEDYLASCLTVTLTKLTIKSKRNLSLQFK